MSDNVTYWVGSLRITGHPLSTFLIGEFVQETDAGFTLRNVIRALEAPQNGRVGLNFMADAFFTEDAQATIEKSAVAMSRLLDPDSDARSIAQIQKFMSGLKLQRAGLVGPSIESEEEEK